MKSLVNTCINRILGHKWLTVLVCLAILILCAVKLDSIANSSSFRDLFNEDNPELIANDRLNDIYAHASANVVLIAVAPQSGTVFAREALAAIETLTEISWQLPYASRVDSLTNHLHIRTEEDDLIIEPLAENAETLTDAELLEISEIALDSRELKNRLVSSDGRVGGLTINFAISMERDAAVNEVNDALEAAIDDIRNQYEDIRFYTVGEMVSNRAFTRTTQNELQILLPTAFVVILLIGWAFTRSVFSPLLLLLLIVFTVGSTMGVAGWSNLVLTPISAYIPIVVMAITVAYSIHIISGTLQNLRNGATRLDAISDSVNENIYPIFLTSLTTAVGFLSLNFSDVPSFRTLGNFVAIGAVLNFFYSMTFLPALLAILPLRSTGQERTKMPDLYTRLADFIVSRRKALLLGMPVISALCVAGIFQIELSDDFTKYYGERHEFRRNLEFVNNNLTGVNTQEYSLDSGVDSGITDPTYLQKIDDFAQWYRQQPGVHHVWVFSDIIKNLNQKLNGNDPAYYRLPEEQALVAQYLLLYELSLPLGRDLNNSINVPKSATRMVVTHRGLSSREERMMAERGYGWLESNAPGLASRPAGFAMMLAYLSERSVRSMLLGTAIAVVVVSVILLLVFRSIRYGLVSLIPNFLPGLMSIGIWGYISGNVGMAAAVFIVISFGIVVDDTIHLMTRYLKARREGGASSPDAVREAVGSAGRALWCTTAVLTLGFAVFAFSGFQPNWSLGVLVSLSVGLAFVLDFLLLPPLLMAIDGVKPGESRPSTGRAG